MLSSESLTTIWRKTCLGQGQSVFKASSIARVELIVKQIYLDLSIARVLAQGGVEGYYFRNQRKAKANLKLVAIDLEDCNSQTIARKDKGRKLLQVYLPRLCDRDR